MRTAFLRMSPTSSRVGRATLSTTWGRLKASSRPTSLAPASS